VIPRRSRRPCQTTETYKIATVIKDGGAGPDTVEMGRVSTAPSPALMEETLVAGLRAAADEGTARIVFHLADGEREMGIEEVVECGFGGARRLAELGVQPGDRVAVLGPNRPEWLVWAVAVWCVGATLVPVALPLRRRDTAAFAEQLRVLLDGARCRLVMADPDLLRFVPVDRGREWSIDGLRASETDHRPVGEDIAVLQFTSGSTARPKGVRLSHRAIMAQLRALGRTMGESSDGSGVVWAPFFHDLGLFGCLLSPIMLGGTGRHLPTELFARAPDEWLRLCSVHRPTTTVAPSSAWSVALRTVLRRGETLDLSSLRRCYFAAERVDPDVVDGLLASAARFGLDPSSLAGTYGMAETVLAVTATPPGAGLRFEPVDIGHLAANGHAEAAPGGRIRQIVSSGVPLEEMELRIVGADGPAPDRQLGEIWVRGRSLMQGYDGADGEADPFVGDGWLATGDTGFCLDGELFVTGRMKDIVIVLGHNYHPEDFEWAAERVPGVRRGRAVAFAREDSEDVVVVIEPEASEDPGTLGPRVRAAIGNAIGVTPADVLVVGRGSILKTSSGKPRRRAMKEAYASSELRTLSPRPETTGRHTA
jgi:fatty-acyl-CoA synthase